MASSSNVDTPLLVKFRNCPSPKFKKHPFKSLLDEPLGVFFSVFHGVLHTEDIRAYIHCDIEEIGSYDVSCVFTENLITNNQLKPEYAHLHRNSFTHFMDFMIFDKDEWVRYILSRIHGEFIWLDWSYKIIEEVIKKITFLHKIGGLSGPRSKLSNTELCKLISATFDGRSMRVDDIRDIDMKFAGMVIGYKVYQSNQLNYVFSNNILIAHQMVKEDTHYDLCSVMMKELMTNLHKIKQDKKNTFWYDLLSYVWNFTF